MPRPEGPPPPTAESTARGLSRRAFVHVAGAGVVLLGVQPMAPAMGRVDGRVLDASGVGRPLGSIHLLLPDGRHAGRRAAPGRDGTFAFADLAPGAYQLHFDGGAVASLDDASRAALSVVVVPGRASVHHLRVACGTFPDRALEVACGDGFYRVLPDGDVADLHVPLGTVVCWRNLDRVPHTVTGGAWGDSGDIAPGAAWYWIATHPGRHAYHCGRRASMHGILHVTA